MRIAMVGLGRMGANTTRRLVRAGHEVAEVWRHGSAVRSWLLDLVATVRGGGGLSSVAPHVEDSGGGRWAVEAASDRAVPVPAVAASRFARFDSLRDAYGDRRIAAPRAEFGGHAVRPAAVPGTDPGDPS